MNKTTNSTAIDKLMRETLSYSNIHDYCFFKLLTRTMPISYAHVDAAVLHNNILDIKYLLNNGGDKYISYYAMDLAKHKNMEIYNLLKEACIKWDEETENNCRLNGNYYLRTINSQTFKIYKRLDVS